MKFKPGQPVLRKNFDHSLDLGKILEVQGRRVVILLNQGGRETFCFPETGGWSLYAE